MYSNNGELLQFLHDSGIIPKARIADAKQDASRIGRDPVTLLVQRGDISLDEVRNLQSRLYGIKFVDLKERTIPFDVLSRIPEPVARRHSMIAFDNADEAVHVAVLDLDAVSILDHVCAGMDKKIIYLTTEDSMRKVLKDYQKALRLRFGDSIQKGVSTLMNAESSVMTNVGSSQGAVAQIVDLLLNHALLSRASYVHFDNRNGDMAVVYRVGGRLYDAMVLPHHLYAPLVTHVKTLAGIQGDKSMYQCGSFVMDNGETYARFDVSVSPALDGEKVTIRVLGDRSHGFMLERLGFSPRGIELVHGVFTEKRGAIFVVGPRRSGKTTCMYTLLDALTSPDVRVGTIEDPIEYDMRGITQTRVDEKNGMTYGAGIKTLIAHDTDVIMVGNADDASVLRAVLRAGSMHARVLTSMTARGVAHALSLMTKVSEDPDLVLSTVDVVVGTRLIKTLGRDKQRYVLGTDDIKKIERLIDVNRFIDILREDGLISGKDKTLKDIHFYKAGSGGYVGDTGIYEVVRMTRSLQDIIARGAHAGKIDREMRNSGALNLFEEALYKAVLGITDIEQVFTVFED